jgi:hypothetical protein
MNYALIEVSSTGDSIQDTVISISTDKNLIFSKAAKLSEKELKNKSTWYSSSYWVYIFDKRGRKLDELEFDSNGRREGTFGKIVRNRGSRNEKVVGTWRK